ncbi:gliding motility protein GldL [Roseivirga sp.]|uniref:type IX secretion system motor protein PorL/GldL n=1 Tax=Roseivirga sp. TaxID=1964215 RepID=UPI003B52478D
MASKFTQNFYGSVMPKIYGLGASVVIVGAMFKLEGWAGATPMLITGLSVEALIFAFSAFEPKATDYTKELYHATVKGGGAEPKKDDISLEKMLKQAAISKDGLQNLKEGMDNLAQNAKSLASMSNAAVATDEYAKNAKTAATSLSKIDQSTSQAAAAFAEVANTVKGSGANQSQLKSATEQYQVQLKEAATQLQALSGAYKAELTDTESVAKYMKGYLTNMETMIKGAMNTAKATEEFQAQMAQLNTNITSLNKVYGAMLSAMKQTNN